MIFVTVGTQIPFDRLVKIVDDWAADTGRDDVFAQIGEGGWQPPHLEWSELIDPAEHRRRLEEADLVIGHAGMGTIISGLELGTPVLVMPRRADLREHRNDHQLATARRFEEMGKAIVAYDEASLRDHLGQLDKITVSTQIEAGVNDRIVGAIRSFVERTDPGEQGATSPAKLDPGTDDPEKHPKKSRSTT